MHRGCRDVVTNRRHQDQGIAAWAFAGLEIAADLGDNLRQRFVTFVLSLRNPDRPAVIGRVAGFRWEVLFAAGIIIKPLSSFPAEHTGFHPGAQHDVRSETRFFVKLPID